MEMKELVKKGYNEGDYVKTYDRTKTKITSFEKIMIDELIIKLSKNAKVLDFWCGAGIPYDEYFVNKQFNVTGIDISKKHIELAKEFIKNVKFIEGDFSTYNFEDKYDAIVSFFAIFHIPRTEHKKLFQRIHSLLNKNGHILITLGATDMECAINPNFVGAPMAWSSYSVEINKKLIQEAGFEIIMAVEDYRTEKHLWILAKKK